MRNLRATLGLVLCITATGSCKDLPTITAGTCGNGFVEPDANEDCEPGGAGRPACRAPGQPGECHYDCSADPTSCPSGFACGTDGICRAPSGTLTVLGSPSEISGDERTFDVSLADFDGDGILDLRVSNSSDIRILYGESGRAPSPGTTIPNNGTRSATGKLTSGSAASLVFGFDLGTAVVRGRTDRTFFPVTFPSVSLADENIRIVVMEAVPEEKGLETVIVGKGQNGNALLTLPPSDRSPQRDIAQLDKPPSALVGRILPIRADASIPCDELAVLFVGEAAVRVLTVCNADGSLSNPAPVRRIDLPAICASGVTDQGRLAAGDFNRDGLTDLLVQCGEGRYAIAWARGGGQYADQPSGTANDRFGPFLLAGNTDVPVLAAGALTEGGAASIDIVSKDAILFRQLAAGADGGVGAAELGVIRAPQGVEWTEAKIADINGDGHLDVVAASDRRIDVYTGTGTQLMAHTGFATSGVADLLSLADFDGDSAIDIGYREKPKSGETLIKVLFGQRFGVPAAPVTVARLDSITEMVGGTLSNAISSSPDSLGDLELIGRSKTGPFVSVLRGATNRQLISPLAMIGPDAENVQHVGVPASFTVGHFSSEPNGGAPHEDIFVLALSVTAEDARRTDRSPPVDIRGWLVPVVGDAEIPTKTPIVGPQIGNFRGLARADLRDIDFGEIVPVAVDLGGQPEGIDEIVTLMPPSKRDGGHLFVQSFDPKFDPQGNRSAIKPVTNAVDFGPVANTKVRPQIRAADFDGDGRKDVVILTVEQPRARIRVYKNTSSGTIDKNATLEVELPADVEPSSFALMNLDSDRELEIVIATKKIGDDPRGSLFVADLDKDGKYVAKPLEVAGLVLPATVQSMAAGDVTGDGVDDVVLVSAAGVQVLRGVPVHP